MHMHTADASIRRIFRGTPYVEGALAYRLSMNYAPFIQDMVMEPDLKTLLGKLKPSVGLAVATNRSNTISDVLKHHGLVDFFDIVVSSMDVLKPKPHQESLLKILDFFQLGPHQAVYVGDSAVDSETAENAGMPFISYKNPDLKADFHVGRLMDISPLLDRL